MYSPMRWPTWPPKSRGLDPSFSIHGCVSFCTSYIFGDTLGTGKLHRPSEQWQQVLRDAQWIWSSSTMDRVADNDHPHFWHLCSRHCSSHRLPTFAASSSLVGRKEERVSHLLEANLAVTYHLNYAWNTYVLLLTTFESKTYLHHDINMLALRDPSMILFTIDTTLHIGYVSICNTCAWHKIVKDSDLGNASATSMSIQSWVRYSP